jgi:hypothetical protein
MSDCSAFLRSIGYNGVLCTSDIACYDGPQFACVTIPTDATLNQVLNAIAGKICEVEASIVVPVNAEDVVYSGTLVFGCFTLVGANVEAVIESLATELCALDATIPADAGDLSRGSGVVYDGGVPPGLTTDPILGLFNDIMAEMGIMVTNIAAAATDAEIADTTAVYFRDSDFVYDGANNTPSGLNVTINNGFFDSVYGINGYIVRVASTVVALTATADNYVDVTEAGTYTVTPVSIAAPAPPVGTNALRLYMFTTNGLNVTATSDLRNTYPINDNLLVGDDVIETRNILNLAVTGAKMETLGAGATVGDTDLFSLTYDTKGRVTAASANYTITGVLTGDLLRYDGAGWVNWVNNFVDTAGGTAGRVPYFTDSNTVADSTLRDNGTVAAFNAAINATRQLYVNATAVGVTNSGVFLISGANASNVGVTGQSTNATNVDIGVLGIGGALITFPKATGIAGLVGTGYTAAAKEAFGAFLAVDTDALATADTFGVYIDAQNSGSGRAYGIVVENGKSLFGASGSTADSAILEVISTTKGVRFPNMTTAQRDLIAGPVAGLVIYNTSTSVLNFYNGAVWGAV